MTDGKRVAARAPEKTPRAVRRAMKVLDRAGTVDRGPRLGRRTRAGARARELVVGHLSARDADRALGASIRARESMTKAGTMPHEPSGKHQRKLAQRRYGL